MAEEKTVREKNQEAAKKQAEVVSQQKNKQIMEFNEKFEGLTKRNQDYMFHLNKALAEKDYAEREKVVSEMYNELMEKQKQGVVANKLYGTVNEKVEAILAGPKKEPKMPTLWELSLDNGLMMLALFCIMYAFLGMFSKSNQNAANGGIITLIVTSIVAGVGLGYFYRAMMPGQSKRRGWLNIIFMIAILMVVWVAAFGIVAIIPPTINVVLPPLAYAVLAVVAYGVRWYLKKKLNFISPADFRRNNQN